MGDTHVDRRLKDLQTVINKRHYIQYVLPLVEAIESTNNLVNNIKIKGIIEKIIASSISQISTRAEEINGEEYIKIDTVTEIIQNELAIHM